ncbi:MAG: hypothetical protein Q7T51_03790 [Candidatus Moranbacteria bacterium]|nr:hypothetical protein [Candidatus Moranbacteria bacterium]
MQETTINLRNSTRPSQTGVGGENTPVTEKKRGKGRVMLILFIIIIIAGGAFGFLKYKKENNRGGSKGSFIDSSKYQAVFLPNGQVYFGKVSQERESFVHLSEVYYLVNNAGLQKQTAETGNANDATKPNSDYSLIKLGNELHGPESMEINRDQILFIENLSNDSKLVNAIKNMQK